MFPALGGLWQAAAGWGVLLLSSAHTQCESGPGETRRKFGSLRALSICFLTVGKANALSKLLLRGRKGVFGFFLPFPSLPTLWPLCPLLPALSLGMSVHLSVLSSPVSALAFSLTLNESSPPLGFGPRIAAQPQALLAKHFFQVVPGPLRAKWLNLQLMFSSHSKAVIQGIR